MFYEVDDIQVAEFGTGDIMIAPCTIKGEAVAISLVDTCGKCFEINSICSEKHQGMKDTDLNTVMRLVFKKEGSIDAFIAVLESLKPIVREIEQQA